MGNKKNSLNIWNLMSHSWKKSFSIATYILAFISTFLSIVGISFQNICRLKLWIWLIIVLFIYIYDSRRIIFILDNLTNFCFNDIW